jgi:hypothetical protein
LDDFHEAAGNYGSNTTRQVGSASSVGWSQIVIAAGRRRQPLQRKRAMARRS